MEAYTIPLLSAVQSHDAAYLGAHDAGARNRFGVTLLHKACRYPSWEAARHLLARDETLARTRDDLGRVPLHDACWNETVDFAFVEQLLQLDVAALLTGDNRGHTPLCYVPASAWKLWRVWLTRRATALRAAFGADSPALARAPQVAAVDTNKKMKAPFSSSPFLDSSSSRTRQLSSDESLAQACALASWKRDSAYFAAVNDVQSSASSDNSYTSYSSLEDSLDSSDDASSFAAPSRERGHLLQPQLQQLPNNPLKQQLQPQQLQQFPSSSSLQSARAHAPDHPSYDSLTADEKDAYDSLDSAIDSSHSTCFESSSSGDDDHTPEGSSDGGRSGGSTVDSDDPATHRRVISKSHLVLHRLTSESTITNSEDNLPPRSPESNLVSTIAAATRPILLSC